MNKKMNEKTWKNLENSDIVFAYHRNNDRQKYNDSYILCIMN